MVEKWIENIEEIIAYSKVRTQLGHSVKENFTEFGRGKWVR
jgi:hypothetical protein